MKPVIHLFFTIIFLNLFGNHLNAQVYEDCVDTLQTWVDKRVENAKKGKKEVIEMPMVVRSTGWGCLCPTHYIGISPYTHEGPWIHIKASKKFPKMDQNGHSLIVTGYFTGKMVKEDFRDENGEPEEWLYTIPEFKIKSWRINSQSYEARPPRIISN